MEMGPQQADLSSKPVLSVVVILIHESTDQRYNTSRLSKCLDALINQVDPPTSEIIVTYPKRFKEIVQFGMDYKTVKFVPVNNINLKVKKSYSLENLDELRAHGVASANGEIICLTEDYALPAPDWCRQIVSAHQEDIACIGGAIENTINKTLIWVVYFCGFGKYQEPIIEGEANYASDVNVSYKNQILKKIRSTWVDIFREPEVHLALQTIGETIALSPKIIVYEHREDLHLTGAIKERFLWGKPFAHIRSDTISPFRGIIYLLLSPPLPTLSIGRMFRNIQVRNKYVGVFLKTFPLVILLTISCSIGELVGTVKAVRFPSKI